jgi:O-antigen/teichoic acid export membrane protein
MAIGKSKMILLRALIGLAINMVLSVLLVSLIGYIGAAIATLAVIYLWAATFNFYHLTRHFNVGISEVFPFLSVMKIIISLLLPTGVCFFMEQFVAIFPPFWKLVLNALIFGPFLLYLWNGHIYTLEEIKKRLKNLNV